MWANASVSQLGRWNGTGNYSNMTRPSLSREQEEAWQFMLYWFYAVGVPAVCAPGAVVTVITLVVFVRHLAASRKAPIAKGRKEPRSLYTLLLGMTAFDFIIQLGMLLFFPSCAFCWRPRERHCYVCHRLLLFIMPILSTMQFCSTWCTVAVTVDRFVATAAPAFARRWCSVGVARNTLIAIVVSGALYRLPLWFEFGANGRMTWLKIDDDYNLYYRTYSAFVVVALVPFTVLIALNVLQLFCMAQRHQKQKGESTVENGWAAAMTQGFTSAGAAVALRVADDHADHAAGNGVQRSGSSKKRKKRSRRSQFNMMHWLSRRRNSAASSSTLTVGSLATGFLVVGTFLFFYVPTFISMALDAAGWRGTTYSGFVLQQALIFGGNWFVGLNSATNFIVYYATTAWFRQLFNEMLCGAAYVACRYLAVKESPDKTESGTTRNLANSLPVRRRQQPLQQQLSADARPNGELGRRDGRGGAEAEPPAASEASVTLLMGQAPLARLDSLAEVESTDSMLGLRSSSILADGRCGGDTDEDSDEELRV